MKGLFLAVFVALSLSWIALVRTDGFSPSLIEGRVNQTSPLTSEVESILSQPFHYLSKGHQCFVFESKDEKYVLKFFNQNYLRTPWYSFLVPKEKAKRARRLHFYENSYAIAYRELGEQILYLGPSDRSLPLLLIDKANLTHTVDLGDLSFVLQKKGTPFYTVLNDIYAKEGNEGLYREIDAYMEAISSRIAKQIADADRNVERNWGYVEGKIFHLDPGRLYYDENLKNPVRLQTEWDRATHSFHKWLKKNYPDAAKYLESDLRAR